MYEKYDDVKKNVRNRVKLEKYLIIDKFKIGKDTYKGYATKSKKKQREVPLELILKLANELGVTVDGIFNGERVPNPNPYDIDKVFENILRAFKEAPNAWGSFNDDDANKKINWTVRNYKKEDAAYMKKNIRLKWFLLLCNCWGKSAEDILRGNFKRR